MKITRRGTTTSLCVLLVLFAGIAPFYNLINYKDKSICVVDNIITPTSSLSSLLLASLTAFLTRIFSSLQNILANYINLSGNYTSLLPLSKSITNKFQLITKSNCKGQLFNLQLHASNGLLLFLVIKKYLLTQRCYVYHVSDPCAALAAIIFVLHPTNFMVIKSTDVSETLSLFCSLLGILLYLLILDKCSQINRDNSKVSIKVLSTIYNYFVHIFIICTCITCMVLGVLWNIQAIGFHFIIAMSLLSRNLYISNTKSFLVAFSCTFLVFVLSWIIISIFHLTSDTSSYSISYKTISSIVAALFSRLSVPSHPNNHRSNSMTITFFRVAYRMSTTIKAHLLLKPWDQNKPGFVILKLPQVDDSKSEINSNLDMSTVYELTGIIVCLGVLFLKLILSTMWSFLRSHKITRNSNRISNIRFIFLSIFLICYAQDIIFNGDFNSEVMEKDYEYIMYVPMYMSSVVMAFFTGIALGDSWVAPLFSKTTDANEISVLISTNQSVSQLNEDGKTNNRLQFAAPFSKSLISELAYRFMIVGALFLGLQSYQSYKS